MITKTALIAALVLGTASVAMAQDFDGNLANRYPAYAEPLAQQTHSSQVLESRNVALTGRPSVIEFAGRLRPRVQPVCGRRLTKLQASPELAFSPAPVHPETAGSPAGCFPFLRAVRS